MLVSKIYLRDREKETKRDSTRPLIQYSNAHNLVRAKAGANISIEISSGVRNPITRVILLLPKVQLERHFTQDRVLGVELRHSSVGCEHHHQCLNL